MVELGLEFGRRFLIRIVRFQMGSERFRGAPKHSFFRKRDSLRFRAIPRRFRFASASEARIVSRGTLPCFLGNNPTLFIFFPTVYPSHVRRTCLTNLYKRETSTRRGHLLFSNSDQESNTIRIVGNFSSIAGSLFRTLEQSYPDENRRSIESYLGLKIQLLRTPIWTRRLRRFDEVLLSSNGVLKEGVPKFLEMQEGYNICMAAYKEIMTLALKANTWVVDVPVLGSIEELHHMFSEPPSPGMEIEYSIESGIVPFKLENVIATLTNVDEWASVFCNIVHNRTAEVPLGVISNLASNLAVHRRDNFNCVKAVFTITYACILPDKC